MQYNVGYVAEMHFGDVLCFLSYLVKRKDYITKVLNDELI